MFTFKSGGAEHEFVVYVGGPTPKKFWKKQWDMKALFCRLGGPLGKNLAFIDLL